MIELFWLYGLKTYPKGINGTMEIRFGFSSPEEVEREFARYIENGVVEVQNPIARPYGLYESLVADPEGNLIELNCSIDEWNKSLIPNVLMLKALINEDGVFSKYLQRELSV